MQGDTSQVVQPAVGTPSMGTDNPWSTFAHYLKTSTRVLCLVGAGLSAPSGLETWRGTNGLWNDINLKELASHKKFLEDPITVWTFYGERLVKSLMTEPNSAHLALAALASRHAGWLTVNQNVDGTSVWKTGILRTLR
jgi:NAD-dependent deacetylase sirtuin 5